MCRSPRGGHFKDKDNKERKMNKYIVIFRHMGNAVTRLVTAETRDQAMNSVCGFVYSCELCPKHLEGLFA